ncbi:Cu(I)/Ag(I) efflux system membrane protein CusA/SilA [Enhydrobacter aerosaccus]|uniref:Cu(I)/Ag(I) efflux system membrane protein CusA/SilA n=1 Tax=Enhydrobacter aerosaccus TaxID=225324 RepID=A0A1T4SKR1_9HYPH|nr:CusA/CzcA family heavy metal efflux RND transporter [Enhydrobacter aerosaccus]SKA28508.1 Cu(I)/Ag(I) efflux system membrane protein CusA/SilA [Enhydrobacter aerosaccus]
MIAGLIRWSARSLLLVFIATLGLIGGGLYAVRHVSLDAIPDLSDTQVIVYTEMPGQAPQVVEDQVTYPLTTAMLAVPRSRAVRGFSFFGVSFVYIIFEDGTDIYWARSRVLEYLNSGAQKLPADVKPTLGPDATGVGWVYQYVVVGANRSLAELRSLQDWFIRFGAAKAEGVAEVASVGGFVRQYNVVVDPVKLRSFGVPLARVIETIRASNREVGGRVVEMAETEFMVRGRGYIKNVADLEQIVLRADGTVPVLLRDVARVEFGPDERRGLTELDGEGEVVSGIVLQRFGQNALDVISNVKSKLKEIAAGLPEGVRIEPVYDRSDLIYRAIDTLVYTLIEESIVVAVVCFVFLLHLRSALVAIITLPVGILMAFLAMHALGIGSNIMSLGGIAIAIGAMIDAAIVMIENAHKHLERLKPGESRTEAIIAAAVEVGPALFFSLLVITVSFLPIFTLEAQEGRLFKPLAWTKSLAMAASALLSVTLVPALMVLFVRGRILPERRNPVNRALIWLYRPAIRLVLWARVPTILLAVAVLGATAWPAMRVGSEFMPSLDEGTLFYMPTTLPGLSVTKSAELLQTQDKIIKSFPEVASVYGKAGRATTATDPAPLEMFETVISLKPKDQWRPGMNIDKVIAELDRALQFPGVSNAWTMPIKARTDMLATGIRTPVGIKLLGRDLGELENLARQVEAAVRDVPGTTSAFAERVTGGSFLDIVPDRTRLAQYGVLIEDLQLAVSSALGGEAVATTVEGRERYTINVRYPRDLRSDPRAIASDVLVSTMSGGMIPLGQLAEVKPNRGPTTIRTENAQLAVYIFIDYRDRDLGSYVADAQRAVQEKVKFPPGFYAVWSGQFEFLQRAEARLQIVVPATLLLIFVLLYLNFQRMTETLIVMLSLPFSLVGGFWLVWWMGFNMSVAVAVGFIALAGVAAETGVVMLIYLDHALAERRRRAEAEGRPLDRSDLTAAIVEGAVERVRPKMMTVTAIMAGLLPILWSTGTGSEVMQRIAVPMIGGMVSSTLLTLLVIPALYGLVKGWRLQPAPGTLREAHP